MDVRYPIGRFDEQQPLAIPEAIERIEALPAELRTAAASMTPRQLDTPYREGGWTARQVIHHLADSHTHCFIRFRFAITEDRPTIKPYDEKTWAELPDGKTGPLEPSLRMIEGMHSRWVALMRSLQAGDFDRTLIHPERGEISLAHLARLYAWHGKHHLAHIAMAKRAAA